MSSTTRVPSVVRVAVRGLMALVMGLVLAECVLQLILSRTSHIPFWYTEGVHVPDKQFGFRFKPGYRGVMRHKDGVFYQSLALDKHGFRMPAAGPDDQQSILLLGGRSMAFSYGLRDEDTLHAAIRERMGRPSTVYNAAWPGFNGFRNFHVYQATLGQEIEPDYTVVLCYLETLEKVFRELPEDLSVFSSGQVDPDSFFKYYDNLVMPVPEGALAGGMGKLYYESFLLNKIGTLAGQAEAVIRPLVTAGNDNAEDSEPELDEATAKARVRQWVEYLVERQGGKDRVLFVFLPIHEPRRPEFYEPLASSLPADVQYLDLHQSMAAELRQTGYLAWGHYTPASVRKIAAVVAAKLNSMQEPERIVPPDSRPGQGD
jgi:hypothetical protein